MKFILLALAACGSTPMTPQAPQAPQATSPDADAQPARPSPVELGPAKAVAAADLDGDGDDEILRFEQTVATWAGQDLGGRFQQAARGDIDGDGDEEAIVATGQGRGVRDAPARVWALHADSAQLLWERDGDRNQVSDLAVQDGRVWLAFFETRFLVRAGFLEADGPSLRRPAHMGMRQRPLPGEATAVGRLYGEQPRSDGDLAIVTPQGRRALPSLRGVRALATADLNGDGHPELIVGDGWHSSYGNHGDPRVRVFTGPDYKDARTIAYLDDSYAVMRLEVVGDGTDARVLATGSSAVYLLSRDLLGWRSQVVAPLTETANAVLVNTKQGPAVAVSGTPARLVPLP